MNDWLILIIVLLIIAIVLDGIRRARKGNSGSVKLSRNARKVDKYFEEQDVGASSDFPSGGARVVADSNDEIEAEKPKKAPQRKTQEPAQESLDFGEPVPMLMESVEAEEHDDVAEKAQESANTSFGDDASHLEPSLGNLDDLDSIDESVEVHSESEIAVEKPAHRFNFQRKKAQAEIEPTSAENDKPNEEIEELLIINVMAKPGLAFNGIDLQNAFVAAQLKYGARQIFHRHLDNDGDASVLYSVANMIEPGFFNLAEMNQLQTPGVCMFLTLPCDGSSIEAYDDMADTALTIARDLDGELKDENRSVMTRQTIEHGRQKVIEFERRRKLMK
jgi:cell division protein ZipA